ncbi:dynamin family protein [Halalkalibacter kiskunsagensis]|uniref:Dynamin family protein n=1 Tax=Halalkalibacter kiskunsagensis TaxID=1548599 RepID=A0ABV6KAA3_9BACI
MSKTLSEITVGQITEVTEKERERYQLLEEKETSPSFQVSFCGHFSAGKSTILNHLLGSEMLPTSPIPTSANIIGIKNGNLGLTVNQTNGDKKEWQGEIPWQRVREWGMDGGGITSLTIQAPLPFLGDSSIIYDTPGVDSTDPTHQSVTLEALYTTDFIVYVMDYNHVQSETNLSFLKQLSDELKPLYLVINQIDKHDENELSFQSFDQSVRDTFQTWGINIIKLCYTSMKARDHHLNQLVQFEKDMKTLLYYGETLVPYAKQRLQQGYYLSILSRLEEDKEEDLDQVKERMKQEGFTLKQLDKRQTLAISYDQIFHAKKYFEEDFENKWQKLVKDITIFPYTTTELVRNWIESIQPGFKVGFLFSKKKTEEEQKVRLKSLLEETEDKVKSQLEFHLHRLFQTYNFTLLTNREEVERAIEHLHATIDASFFENAVQTGPKNREYVYTFTKDRTIAIVKELRQKSASVIALMTKGMETHWEKSRNEIEKELEQLHEIDSFVMQLNKIEDSYNKVIEGHQEKVKRFEDTGAFERVIIETMDKETPAFTATSLLSSVTLPEESVIETKWEQEDYIQHNDFNEEQSNKWINDVLAALRPFSTEERMEYERTVLQERLHRFQDQTFTISLFGAFSAGKSSFANALLGETILPVSPHPTTATINIVKKSEDGHRSKTAVVNVKTREQLAMEIQSVAEQLDSEVTLDTIASWKESLDATTSWQKTYQAYIATLKKSLLEEKFELGTSFQVELADLQPFVANEHNACLIDSVTLYYDCPLTEKGIILVDTPGVNSIHGRHTNVAFKQLRDSDAIFYLTYYNHAFSKADQQFLQQMAKVNEGFRSDKLYFVLNAADLASSPFELNGVKKHVHDQLVTNGVKNPRLYPLSSKKGLEGKRNSRSGDELFDHFEKAFYQNTITELKRLSYDLVKEEVMRYQSVLEKGLEYATIEESGKEEKREQLVTSIAHWEKQIQNLTPLTAYSTSKQEVSQLFLYLRERARYVLGDQFSESINVTTIVGSNKRMQQQALLTALKEWRSEGEHFIKQELEATFVRIELALYKAIENWMNETVQEVRLMFPAFSFSHEIEKVSVTPDISERLIQLDIEQYMTYFQSLRNFFEQGKLKTLKEDIINDSSKQVSKLLREIEQKTEERLTTIFEQLVVYSKDVLSQGLYREIARFDSLTDPKHLQSLKQELETFKRIK